MAKRKASDELAEQIASKRCYAEYEPRMPCSPMPPRNYDSVLNRDVRSIMYDYMTLPPLAHGKEWAGLALSCKDACEEMRQAAIRQLGLAKLCVDFETKSGISLQAPDLSTSPFLSWSALRQVIITLPAAALSTQVRPGESVSNFEELYPLFALQLDKLTLLFKDSTTNASKELKHVDGYKKMSILTNIPTRKAPWLQKLTHAQHLLGSHVMYRSDSYYRSFVRRVQRRVEPPIMRFKHLILAWDLRDERQAAAGKGRRKWLMEGRLYEQNASKKARGLSYRYELMGKGSLVGECGLVSEFRWGMQEDLRELFEDRRVWTDIASEEIGHEYVKV